MFGSNDDKKAPAEAGEKKGLFGWLRKKPQTPAAEPPPSEPLEDSQPFADEPDEQAREQLAEVEAEQPEPIAEVQVEPEIASQPEPETEPEPVAQIDESMNVPEAPALAEIAVEPAPVPVAEEQPAKLGFFARLKQGLSKTSASIGEGMASLFLGKKAIDDDLLDELETRLLTADVGVEATTAIMQNLSRRVSRTELADSGALYKALQEELAGLLKPVEQPLRIDAGKQPFVILVVGVNGVGKTTTIGKLAKKLQLEGKKVMLAAGDTFRAAAVEQLQVWGERNNIAVIAQHTGADSASVIFDAVQAAKARGVDVLIADTA
ncbi:MAG TPA: signal recognition particle receptor subunit alpha, partial [Pseudomonas nitrititolerans]|nr:signal recognition particle receptor subunit alpha [Stutzerimonas nitrititolerans]